MEKYTVSIKSCYNLKKSLFVLFNATAEVREPLFFDKKTRKTFLQLELPEKLCQTHRKFTATLSEKFIGNNLSITDIALKTGLF